MSDCMDDNDGLHWTQQFHMFIVPETNPPCTTCLHIEPEYSAIVLLETQIAGIKQDPEKCLV